MYFSSYDSDFIRGVLKDYSSNKDTFDIVCDLIRKTHGKSISNIKVYKMARDLMDGVAKFGGIGTGSTNADTSKILDDYFYRLKVNKSEEDRLSILKRINFGLRLHEDEKLRIKLENGERINDLFDEHYKAEKVSAENLENSIKSFFSDYGVSEQRVKNFTMNLMEYNILESSELIGRDAERIMCIVAARAYSASGGAKSIEDVTDGIHSTQGGMRTFGDALNKGVYAKDSYQLFDYDDECIIITIFYAAMAIVFLVWYLTAEGLVALATAIGLLIGIPLLIWWLDKVFSERAGVRAMEREFEIAKLDETLEIVDESEDECEFA